MGNVRTLVATPDPFSNEIRRGRMQAIADSLVLPIALVAQAIDRARRINPRER